MNMATQNNNRRAANSSLPRVTEGLHIIYEFSGAKSVLLGLAAMHESIEELRADMKGESK